MPKFYSSFLVGRNLDLDEQRLGDRALALHPTKWLKYIVLPAHVYNFIFKYLKLKAFLPAT